MFPSRRTSQFGPRVGRNWSPKRGFRGDESSTAEMVSRGSTIFSRLAKSAGADCTTCYILIGPHLGQFEGVKTIVFDYFLDQRGTRDEGEEEKASSVRFDAELTNWGSFVSNRVYKSDPRAVRNTLA